MNDLSTEPTISLEPRNYKRTEPLAVEQTKGETSAARESAADIREQSATTEHPDLAAAATEHPDLAAAATEHPDLAAAHRESVPAVEALADVPKELPPVKDKANEWTIAVDLMLNLNSQTPHGTQGAEMKANMLRDLAGASKDKPISFIVQVSTPPGENKISSQSYPRFLIQNGTVTELQPGAPSDKSKGVSDLVRYAAQELPSQKLGLVVFSHGFAQQGLAGDRGRISLSDFSSSVEKALSEAGHGKLDFLAFDSCLMSSTATLLNANRVAKNVVASAEVLPCKDNDSCGLDLNQWFSDLMANPSQSPQQAASDAVRVSKDNSAQWKPGVGPSTLSFFELGEPYQKIERAVNDFGTQLAEAMKRKGNREAINAVVSQTEHYDRAFLNSMDPPPRDLTDFARRISERSEDRTIKDPESVLRNSAMNVISAISDSRVAFYGTNQNSINDDPIAPEVAATKPAGERRPYNQLGGLSIFLPDDERSYLADTAYRRVLNLCNQQFSPTWSRTTAPQYLKQLPELSKMTSNSPQTKRALSDFALDARKLKALSEGDQKRFNSSFEPLRSRLSKDIARIGTDENLIALDRSAMLDQVPPEYSGWRAFLTALH